MDQALGGSAFDTLNASVKKGKLERAVLERAAGAILREKIAGGLFDRTFDGVSDGVFGSTKLCQSAELGTGGILDAPKHRKLALQAAQEGTVLLKNSIAISPQWRKNFVAEKACSFSNHSDCYGDPLSVAQGITTSAACCALCQQTQGCAVAVWIPPSDTSNQNECLLKRACSQPRQTLNRVRCELPGTVDMKLPLTPAAWNSIKQLAIVGPLANASEVVQGSYTRDGAAIKTVLGTAPYFVPATTKIVSAATNVSILVDLSLIHI